MKVSRSRRPFSISASWNSQLPVSSGLVRSSTPRPRSSVISWNALAPGTSSRPFAVDVLLVDQAFDDRRARRRRAQALLLHRLAQLVVVDQLARAFHRRQQRRFGVARRRPRLQRLDVDALGARHLAGGDGDEVGVVLLRLAAVDGEPAGLDHHLAVGLEPVVLAGLGDGRDPRRDHELGGREEHREEALGDHVVELGLDLGQALRRQQRRDDREVVRDLGVVEDLLDRLDVAFLDRRLGVHGERAQRARAGLSFEIIAIVSLATAT